jgi:3-methyladenine DNA glycosylase AlkD
MNRVAEIQKLLRELINVSEKQRTAWFKTGPGEYGEHDKFLGVRVPTLRMVAKKYPDLSFEEVKQLLLSAFNEERLLALFVLVKQYQKSDEIGKERIYNFYYENINCISNWNLVDASAHVIVGAYLLNKQKDILLAMADSHNMWERRIAIVSTWAFIRNSQLAWTFRLAQHVLSDEHDLIHKAVGWMLREVGKRDMRLLKDFLDEHAASMPRVMLRYAIERMSKVDRKAYLAKKVASRA